MSSFCHYDSRLDQIAAILFFSVMRVYLILEVCTNVIHTCFAKTSKSRQRNRKILKRRTAICSTYSSTDDMYMLLDYPQSFCSRFIYNLVFKQFSCGFPAALYTVICFLHFHDLLPKKRYVMSAF
jgi:hypothetical protein